MSTICLRRPTRRLSTADYAIGLYCARLVRDGGTLQIGIGELGDAVVYGLQLRQQQNGEFREILQGLEVGSICRRPLIRWATPAPFETGLYACTEMFVDGFLDLYRSGVLRRRVYDDLRMQRLLNDATVGERIDEPFLAALSPRGLQRSVDGGGVCAAAGGRNIRPIAATRTAASRTRTDKAPRHGSARRTRGANFSRSAPGVN